MMFINNEIIARASKSAKFEKNFWMLLSWSLIGGPIWFIGLIGGLLSGFLSLFGEPPLITFIILVVLTFTTLILSVYWNRDGQQNKIIKTQDGLAITSLLYNGRKMEIHKINHVSYDENRVEISGTCVYRDTKKKYISFSGYYVLNEKYKNNILDCYKELNGIIEKINSSKI